MNEDPLFLSLRQVLGIHERTVRSFGGLDGVRDVKTLEGAVMQPQNDFFYGEQDIFGVAAAYAYHIAQAQAFFDGNKRTGIAAALIFLEGEGYDTACEWQTLHDAMIGFAEKRLDKGGLAEFFRSQNFPRRSIGSIAERHQLGSPEQHHSRAEDPSLSGQFPQYP